MSKRNHSFIAKLLIGVLLFSSIEIALPWAAPVTMGTDYVYAETTVGEAIYGFELMGTVLEGEGEGAVMTPEFDSIAYDTGVLFSWKLPVWEEGDTDWTLLRDGDPIASGQQDTLYYEDIGLAPETSYAYTLEVGNPFDSSKLLLDQAVTTLPLGAGVQSEILKTSTGEPVKLYNQDKLDMTPDGGTIAFSSMADDLVVNDENDERDIFVRLENGAIERVNVGINGAEADADSKQPSISDDGNLVVFASYATNLDEHEWTDAYQIYLHHRNLDLTELISVSMDGTRGDFTSDEPVISGDGRYIAFRSRATNLIAEETGDGTYHSIYLYDRQTGEIEWITRAYDGGAPDGNSSQPAISDDGRYIVFASQANNLMAHGTNGGTEFHNRAGHIYLWEQGVGIRQLSMLEGDLDVEHLGYSNGSPYISEDGSKVIFYTTASDAAEEHLGLTTNGLVVWDRDTDALESAVYKANGSSLSEGLIPSAHQMSGDGRYVLFHSVLDEQITPQEVEGSYTWALYLRELDSGKVWLVSMNDDGALYELDHLETIRVNHDGTVVLYPGYEDDEYSYTVLYRAELGATMETPYWDAAATFSATEVGQSYIGLSWDAAEGTVESYRIYRDGVLIAEQSGTTYTAAGLTPGTSYTFTVEAVGAGVTTPPLALTISTAEEIGGEAGLIVTAEPGGIAQLNWDGSTGVPSAEGYRIERRIAGDDAWQIVQELAGLETTAFADSGLLADTLYEYRIMLLIENGDPQEHTMTRQVQTSNLALDEMFWSLAEQPVAGYTSPGSELQFIVRGEMNREVAVVISYDSWLDDNDQYVDEEPVARESVVSLTEEEGSTGIYRGAFTIPDHAVRFHGIEVILTDGVNQLARSSGGMNIGVLGELVAEVSSEGDSLFAQGTVRLRVWSDQAQYGEQIIIDETGTYTFSNLLPADDYRLRLERVSGGIPLVTVDDVTVRGGRGHLLDAPVPLAEHGPSIIRVEVIGADGLTPLHDMRITVSDADTGQILKHATSNMDEPVQVFYSYDSVRHANAERLRIAANPKLGQQFVAVEQTVDLVPGEQTISLTPSEFDTVSLTGKVVDESGAPAVGVEVTATGYGYRSTDVTDAAGEYAVQVFSGDVTVSAAHRYSVVRYDQSEYVQLTVTDQPVTDVNLLMTASYRHEFILNSIRYPGENGEEQVFEQFGRSEAAGLVFAIYHPDNLIAALAAASRTGVYPVEHYFTSAQYNDGTVIACIQGLALGLPDLCQEIELDPSETNVRIDFVYELSEGTGGLQADFVRPDGNPTTAFVALYDHQEQLVAEKTYLATQDNVLALYPLEPGEYKLRATGSRQGPQFVLEETIWIPEGEIVDLGTLELQERGSFGWQPGNTITVNDPIVMPGRQARFRVAYQHHGDEPAEAAKLRIHLPEAVTVNPATITWNNAATTVDTSGGMIVVPLGSLEPGDQGSVHFSVDVLESARTGEYTVQASLTYESGSETREESIGSVNLLVGGMTLTLPSTIHERVLVAQGKAPAGSNVRVSVDGQPLGQTIAAPNGYWRTELSIPGNGGARWLHVEAVAVTGSQVWRASPAEVLLDPELPRLTNVEFRQLTDDEYWDYSMPLGLRAAAGDWISFQTSGGIARFPRTILAGLPFEFKLHFNEPQRVSNVRVHVEGPAGGIAEAVYDEQEQNWHAIIETDRNAEWRAGMIWVDYDHDHRLPPVAANTMLAGEAAQDFISEPIDSESWEWPDHGLTDDDMESNGQEGPVFQMSTDYYQLRGGIQARLDLEFGTVESEAAPPEQPFQINTAYYGGPDYELPEHWIWMKVSLFQRSRSEIGVRMRGEVELEAFLENNVTAPFWEDGAELILTDTDATSTILSWHPAYDDLWVQRYEIEQLDTSGQVIRSHEVFGDTFQIELEGLMAGETYRYRVVAEDPAGLRTAGPELTFIAGDPDQLTASGDVQAQRFAVQQHVEPKWLQDVRIAAAEKVTRVKIATDFMLDIAGPFGDIAGTFMGGLQLEADINALNDMLQRAQARCNGGIPPELQRAVDEAMIALAASYTMSTAFATGGVALGMTGVGAPGAAALAVIGTLSDFGMGAVSDIQKNQAQEAFKRLDFNDECEEEVPEPPTPPKSPAGGDPSGSPVANPSWKIDPSGFVYEVVEDNRIEDVMTTLLYSEDGVSPYEVWDGEWWGEENPQTTDSAGWYGWDVPQGWWRVIYEKEGYETTYSLDTYGPIEVPPPHFEVNVPMKSYAPPEIEQVDAALDGEAVEVRFNRHIRMHTIGEHTAQLWTAGDDPEQVEGAWLAVDAVSNPYKETAEDVAQTIRFVPAEPLVLGDHYRLYIRDLVESYAEVSLMTVYDERIVVEEKPAEPGEGEPGEGEPGEGEPGEGEPGEGEPGEGEPGEGEPGEGEPGEGEPGEGEPGEGEPGEGEPGEGEPGEGEPGGGSRPITPWYPPTLEDEPSDEEGVATAEDRMVELDDGRIIIHLEELADQLDVAAMKWQVERIDQPQPLPSDSFTMLNYNMNLQLSGQRDGESEWQPIAELPLSVIMQIDLSAYGIDVADADKTGLYVYDKASRSWRYMMGRYDETSGTLTVMLDRVGTFSLLEADVSFADIVGHWAQRPIEILAGRGIISGRSEAQFDPNTPINRAEVTALLVRMLRLSVDDVNRNRFEDVEAQHWFAAEVAAAAHNEVVYGVTEHTFEPFRAISRQEMAAMIVRILKRVGVNTHLAESDADQVIERFADRDQLAGWAKADMGWLVKEGLVTGRSLTEMAPRASLTRAEAAMMLSGLLDTWWEHHFTQYGLDR